MSENKQTTDNELLLQIVGYNSDAFEQLYSRYSATIYSLIKEIITNPKLAENILLNVFSVFLKRIDYYSTTSNDIFTWLTLLARNISIDALKRMKFVEDIPIYSDDYEIESILPNLSRVIAPINLDERSTLGEKIKLYKSHLTEVQNLVLSLVYFEGLNEEEIAKRLNVSVVTVRQKVLSIMESLHHQYTGHTEDVNINKEVLSLIKLEALGCLSSEERTLFNEIRKNDPDFLWKELGEYQNLTALLATPIPLQNPGHELNGEIKDVFTKILQGSEVDYPIIAPEPALIKQFQEPIPELVQQQIQNPIPEVIMHQEIQEAKKTGFELKFRERDPKELSILKKVETIEPKSQPVPVIAKKETEIQFRNNKTPDKKSVGITDRKSSSLETRETISAVIKNDNSIQNKTSIVSAEKLNLQIENDDPSIVIEEPKQAEVREDITVKNRLIPNSSINLKEFFKKDERAVVSREIVPVKIVEEKKVVEVPLEPVVQKSAIMIKTNEPPKEFRRSSVFVDKNENIIQSKPIIPVVQKPSVENKTNEPVKEIQKLNTEVVKVETTIIEKPAVPVVQKSDIIIKANEPPKEFRRSSVFVDKNENIIQSKPIIPVVQKPSVENKTNELVKEIQKLNTEVVKVETTIIEKPVVPVVQKSDIIIKANEPPKEFRRSSVFVDKNENLVQGKQVIPTVQKPSVENKINEPVKEIQTSNIEVVKVETTIIEKPVVPAVQKPSVENKTNEPVKEIQKLNTEVVKEEKMVIEKPVVPAVQKSDIIIMANEPPKEVRRSSVFADKNENIIQSKPVIPVVQKPSMENKTNEPFKEIQTSNIGVAKEEKPIEIKPQQAATKPDIKTSTQSINQKEKLNYEIKKDENLFERINSPIDRSNLKIRETVFAENEKKTEMLQHETSTVPSESNSKKEKVDPTSNLTETINIDEVLSNIEAEKPAPVVLSESESYEKEIVRLKKKLRRNILVSAAVFVILATASVFVYFQFQKVPVKVADKIVSSEKINFPVQTNLIINQELIPEILTETPVVTSPLVEPEQPVTNKKIMIQPLREVSNTEESTLLDSNTNNNNLSSNGDKQLTQTAAAKTETIPPPKETKKVEEEPAFFVAVEEMPELIGGIKGLQNRIVYPEIAKRVGIDGKVLVQAIVDETGKVISANVIKGIGAGCNEVALDAVRNSQFTPGKQRGKTVKTQVTIPIVFKK